MLVSISIENFRSFSSEETFSMVASERLAGSHTDHALPIPNSSEKVLRAAVLYGANGAGKSNLFKALRFIERIALRSNNKNAGTKRERYLFCDDSTKPSSFDLQFIANNKLYRFGFKVDDVCITEEWLIEVIGSKEKIIYERLTNPNGIVSVDAPGATTVGPKLAALAMIGGPQNQSFLATIRATLNSSEYGDELSGILEWFKSTLTMIAPDETYAKLGRDLSEDNDFLKFAGDFLQASATGVDHLIPQKTEISEDDLRSLLPKEVAKRVIDAVAEDESERRGIIHLPNGNELMIEKAGESRFYKIAIQASHKLPSGNSFSIELNEESDGTKRLLDFIPALHQVKKTNSVYFIDEIDRSMHPMLVWKFLEFFLRSCNSSCSQIIVTTHESNLLDLDLLRRDEIWFVEKDQNLSTRIYSLADFKVRTDQAIQKHYLNGRFGAVPFLGKLENILPKFDN